MRFSRSALAIALALLVSAPLSAQSPSSTTGFVKDAKLATVLGEIEPARIRMYDSMLVSFGTRHTMSDTLSSTRGIGAARRWIKEQLSVWDRDCNGCLNVQYHEAAVPITRRIDRPVVNVVNVLGWMKGRDTSRVVVIGGHYDSCVCSQDAWDFTSDAPGADDDGSGTAAVMELARVFAKHYPQGLETSVIFALYAGEENGLLGSTALAQRLRAEGYTVVAAFTDDIVGNVVADDGTKDDNTIRIFADDPDNGPSRELGRYVWAIGATYTPTVNILPVFRLDRIGRGGDHSPFVRQGDAGLRFTEMYENYKRQHLPTDDLANVDFNYVAKVARLNAATVGSLAAAPPMPTRVRTRRDRASGGQKWEILWEAIPQASGYEILWRRSISAQWEKVIPVPAGQTALVVDEQLDDGFVGVRSIGAGGHRSLAQIYPAPPAPRPAGAGGRGGQ
jgi:hypothetical protein